MSVAYELDDVVGFHPSAPRVRALTVVGAAPLAAPLPLPAPLPRSTPAPVRVLRPLPENGPLRLTRRGVVVLGAVVTAVAVALVMLAAWSARPVHGGAASSVGPRVVTVQAGDTLWSIASAAAPDVDPRVEIATIDRLNGLHGAALVPGQQLRVH